MNTCRLFPRNRAHETGMTPERWEQINKLYHAALEREPDLRADFLNQACVDAELRREVERLMASHEQAGSFMETPAAQVGERSQQIDRLLKEALTHPREQRAALLAEACAGDEALRREVESLLAASEEAGGSIETPPSEAADVLLRAKETRAMVGLTLGHYQIQSLLGSGGMGEVYRARDMRLGREVAVKILPEHLRADPEALRRFEREAMAVAALSHPNILAIHD